MSPTERPSRGKIATPVTTAKPEVSASDPLEPLRQQVQDITARVNAMQAQQQQRGAADVIGPHRVKLEHWLAQAAPAQADYAAYDAVALPAFREAERLMKRFPMHQGQILGFMQTADHRAQMNQLAEGITGATQLLRHGTHSFDRREAPTVDYGVNKAVGLIRGALAELPTLPAKLKKLTDLLLRLAGQIPPEEPMPTYERLATFAAPSPSPGTGHAVMDWPLGQPEPGA